MRPTRGRRAADDPADYEPTLNLLNFSGREAKQIGGSGFGGPMVSVPLWYLRICQNNLVNNYLKNTSLFDSILNQL